MNISANFKVMRSTATLAAICAVLTVSEASHAARYHFTRIVDSTMLPPNSFSLPPYIALDLNNAGTVMFDTAQWDGGAQGQLFPKIYTASGGQLQLVVETQANADGTGVYIDRRNASFNDSGVVAYSKRVVSQEYENTYHGIFRSDGVEIHRVFNSDVANGAPQIQSSRLLINNAGEVAFRLARYVATFDWDDVALVRSSGGPLVTIAMADPGDFSDVDGVGMNENGLVAALASYPDHSGYELGVIAGNGGPPFSVFQPDFENGIFANEAAVNNSGKFVIAAGGNLLLVDGPSVTPILPPQFVDPVHGLVPTAAGYVSFNDLDQVAYQVVLSGELSGDYYRYLAVGPDPVKGKLIGPFDALDGSTIAPWYPRDPSIGPPVINNRGQVAFAALLADGRTGIYLATPIPAGDFNENLVVDGQDLVRWRSGFGSLGATHANGDADEDGDVDGADLLIWQRQLGTNASTMPTTAPVPEPAGLSLIAIAACMAFSRRSCGRHR